MRIIGGKYKGKKLLSPVFHSTRPTTDRTRETLFNILLHNPSFGPRVLMNKKVLDVFAGTGALGLEALSRGASSVNFIENNKNILPILHANVKAFHLLPSCIIEQDGSLLNLNHNSSYDLIFLDPPYHNNLLYPSLIELESKGWVDKNALFVLEIAKNETFLLPSQFSLILERSSGATQLLFCTLH